MASAAPAAFLNCFQEFLESDGGAESIGPLLKRMLTRSQGLTNSLSDAN
jgi:hypothetical protein